MSQFLAVLKVEYVPLTNDSQECIPGNIEALQYGLEALQKQDAQDYARMKECWKLAHEALAEESEDETGAGAIGSVMVNDDFGMREMSEDWGGGRAWPYGR